MIEYSKQLAENIAQLGQSDTGMAFTLRRAFGEEIDRLDPRQFPSELRLRFLKLRDKARQYGRMNGFANTEIPSFVAMGREAMSILAAYQDNPSSVPSQTASDPIHDNNMLDIFISHSGKDEKLAAALIDLIIAATNVPHGRIRCTSVDGYRLPGGANPGFPK
jgi:hypothetical protein